MAKLREVKKRQKDIGHIADLRGLSQELLLEASPYACLSIHGIKNEEKLSSIITKYELEKEPSNNKNIIHLHTRIREDGTHKLQAVTLFVAGLDCYRHCQEASFFLSEISRLHKLLTEATRGVKEGLKYSPDEKIKDWVHNQKTFSIDPVVTLHLEQAGFDIKFQQEVLNLEKEDIEVFIHKMTKTKETHTLLYKVG